MKPSIFNACNYSTRNRLTLYFKSGTSSRVNDRKEDREKRRTKESEQPSLESPKKPRSDKPRNKREDTYITLKDGTRKRVEKKEVEADPTPSGENVSHDYNSRIP